MQKENAHSLKETHKHPTITNQNVNRTTTPMPKGGKTSIKNQFLNNIFCATLHNVKL